MPEEHPAVELFYSYSHKDEELRVELEKHLSILRRSGVIADWHDRRIGAGTEWAGEIDEHLERADVILLLVSADFLASDYCYDIEAKRALERHEEGAARVIPVVLRPVEWYGAPFGRLQALPRDARAITTWRNRDEAFVDVASGIRRAVEDLVRVPGRRRDERAAGRARVWRIPHNRNPNFVGREGELARLRKRSLRRLTGCRSWRCTASVASERRSSLSSTPTDTRVSTRWCGG